MAKLLFFTSSYSFLLQTETNQIQTSSIICHSILSTPHSPTVIPMPDPVNSPVHITPSVTINHKSQLIFTITLKHRKCKKYINSIAICKTGARWMVLQAILPDTRQNPEQLGDHHTHTGVKLQVSHSTPNINIATGLSLHSAIYVSLCRPFRPPVPTISMRLLGCTTLLTLQLSIRIETFQLHT